MRQANAIEIEATPARIRQNTVLEKLSEFLQAHRMGSGSFEDFENQLHERLMHVERDLLAEDIAARDVNAQAIEVEGKTMRRVLHSPTTYMTGAGPVVVERWLYRDRTDDAARSVSPLERRIGIIGGFWTPRAAKQAMWVVSQITPQKSAELFERIGNMEPSKSSLDRLPKELSGRWEERREEFEAALRDAVVIPEGAESIAVSIDGVMAPMEGTNSVEKRREAAKKGRLCKGPVGYREMGCATVSFCDKEGEMLSAIRLGRASESKKATLKESLTKEVLAILRKRPELKVVKIADAVHDNWEYLAHALPQGEEAIDFFHAAEHLSAAIADAYGDGTRETRHKCETLREILRDEDGGVKKVIKALDYLCRKYPQRQTIRQALGYFRRHRHRMEYSRLKARGLPIGSGAVEAACKTLVTQRLKLSGMYWGAVGAQAILTMRAWDQSERFDQACALLAATYQSQVTVLANVIPFMPPRPARASR
jgi:hypothetical protein